MVKQTKTFKKGNVTKKALSAILAASMVMTSSSFVMAAPVEVEDVAVEVAAETGEVAVGVEEATEETAEEAEVVEEEDAVADENVGVDTYTLTGVNLVLPKGFLVKGDKTSSDLATLLNTATVDRKKGTVAEAPLKLTQYFNDDNWKVTIKNKTTGAEVVIEDKDDYKKLSTEIGDYQLEVKAAKNKTDDGSAQLKGTVVADFSIVESDVTVKVDGEDITPLKDGLINKNQLSKDYVFTGSAIEPVVNNVVLDGKILTNGIDYEVSYKNNEKLGKKDYEYVDERPAIVITFKNQERKIPSKTIYFTIVQANIESAVIDITNMTQETEYNGSAQAPVVDKVTLGGKTLEKGKDYAVKLMPKGSKKYDISTAKDAVTDAGVYDIYVVGIGNYDGEKLLTKAQYEVKQRELSQENVTVTVDDVEYDDNAAVTAPSVFGLVPIYDSKGNLTSVKKSGKSVVTVIDKATEKPIDVSEYDIQFVLDKSMHSHSIIPVSADLGSYEIEIVPSAKAKNYKKADVPVSATYNVVLNSLAMIAKKAVVGNLTYTGIGQIPSVKIEGSAATVTKNDFANYTVEFPNASDCVNAGTYEIKLVGKNKYAGQTATIPFKINPAPIPKDTLGSFTINKMYAPISHVGNPEKPFVDIVFAIPKTAETAARNYQLVEGTDFSASVNTASKTVTVVGKGNFTGVQVYDYTKNSTQTNLNDSAIQVTMKKTFTYCAKAIEPSYDDFELTEVGPSGSRLIVPKADYEIVDYIDNVEAGTGYIVIEATKATQTALGGQISYTGTRIIPFEIAANEVATVYKLDTSKVKDEIPYDGLGHVYGVATENKDGAIMIKTIKNNAYAAPSEVKSVKYFRDGKEINTKSGKFEDWAAPGTITVEVTMKNYSGKLTYSYTIAGKELTEAITIDYNIADQAYTGEEIKPAVKITEKYGYVGTIKEGRDYKITYVNNVNPGRAYAVVEGIGNYSGKYYVPFNIIGKMDQKIDVLNVQERDLGNGTRTLNSKGTKIKYTVAPKTAVTYTSSNPDVVSVDAEGNIKYTGLGEATITIAAEEGDFYKAEKVEVKVVVTLKRPTMTLFTRDNAFTFTTSTVNGAKQFEIQYATNKEFENAKSKVYSTTGKLRQVKVSAKDKTTYHVRIRAINGSTKTAWSAYKTVATK